MSNILEPKKKKWLSNIVLISFLLLVVATSFLSNAFKASHRSHNEFIEQSLVFNNKELDQVTRLILKNKSGEYSFERIDTNQESAWHMTSPKNISSSSAFVEKLFSALNTIKTKKLLIDNPANNSNFSLEKPTATLTLTEKTGKSILLSVGIMNTIDNSTYVKISGKNGIYHVEAPSISLENISLPDLVKSTIFDLDLKKIISFKIFKKKSFTSQFEVNKKDGHWISYNGKTINPVRLEDMLNEFVNLKSSFILDEQTEAQKKVVQSLLLAADYNLKVAMDDNQLVTFRISAMTKSIPDLNLNDEPHFIIMGNNSPIVHVVRKEFINLFELKNESLKSLE